MGTPAPRHCTLLSHNYHCVNFTLCKVNISILGPSCPAQIHLSTSATKQLILGHYTLLSNSPFFESPELPNPTRRGFYPDISCSHRSTYWECEITDTKRKKMVEVRAISVISSSFTDCDWLVSIYSSERGVTSDFSCSVDGISMVSWYAFPYIYPRLYKPSACATASSVLQRVYWPPLH